MTEYIEKAKLAYREFKKKCHVAWCKFKLWCRKKLRDYERKKGLSERCAYCVEHELCEYYNMLSPKHQKAFIHPVRCSDFVSTK